MNVLKRIELNSGLVQLLVLLNEWSFLYSLLLWAWQFWL